MANGSDGILRELAGARMELHLASADVEKTNEARKKSETHLDWEGAKGRKKRAEKKLDELEQDIMYSYHQAELPLEESEVLRQSVGAEALDVARAIRDDIVTISAAGRSVTMSGDQLHVAAEEAR